MVVSLGMIASKFFTQVQFPVRVEVAVHAECPQTQYGFGSVEGPTSAAAVHAVLHQMAAGALDDARCDREPLFDGLAVAHVASVVFQIVRGFADGVEGAAAERCRPSGLAHGGRDLA